MVDKEKFRKLYEDRTVSAKTIALAFGVSTRTVHRWAKEFDLTIRSEKKYRKPEAGEIYNRLTFLAETVGGGGRKYWLCKCRCGVEKEFPYWGVFSGKTISCGCYQREVTRNKHWTGCGEISGRYWSSLKRCARCRQLDFTVSIEDAWRLFQKQQGRCALSGLQIELSRMANKCPQTASLDRIDNNRGYVDGNVQWLHKDINTMKHTMSQQRFVKLCANVAQHTKGGWQDE